MRRVIQKTVDQVGSVVLGKETQIKLAIACLLSEGHLLIEDMPGMGKTTLAHALAKVFNLSYNRIQFTSDILPADIIGAPIFDKDQGTFVFHEGPIFNQLILADEINRTTPKSQSALLEAMEERQVTVEGEARSLPEPFFVIATQNPSNQAGTFPLPESQLDRFLMRIELGYPDPIAERTLLQDQDRRVVIGTLATAINLLELKELQQACKEIKVSEALLDYLQRIIAYTREAAEFTHGISPRGAMALLASAKSWAFMHDREFVVPEDVQAVLPSVVEHRLREASDFTDHVGTALAQRLLNNVDVIG
ncbi:MAG: AAA family ATPase [Pseudomonadales bacterium]|nr:AAA family ATPase [Pseudomonadales bacterium]MBO6566386.1 AAA family ATPase [Pseudomonadales bacterium]MBO6595044.1 AAA family ATPase [Pseudomonadales bacterium]MBO6821397.1 AAA family ATPase [Pseudomonadales bacterium]